MAMPEFVADSLTESVLSLKAVIKHVFFAELQSFTMNGSGSFTTESVLVRLQTFHINMKALQKTAMTKSLSESVFSKASGLYSKWQ